MEYSIQELSRLSGVTTRTLRWYDQIGLLKPSRVAESGYRYYGRAEVDRLQDILYYRALGVELARIKECLDDPSFDRLAARCIIRSKKSHPGVEAKRAWLRERLQEGHVFRKLDTKGVVFIEYAPLETAWVPVEGDNYLYIYCLWVSGEFKGKG